MHNNIVGPAQGAWGPGHVVVEVGAFDGELYSNSLAFERDLGWTAVLVEVRERGRGRLG